MQLLVCPFASLALAHASTIFCRNVNSAKKCLSSSFFSVTMILQFLEPVTPCLLFLTFLSSPCATPVISLKQDESHTNIMSPSRVTPPFLERSSGFPRDPSSTPPGSPLGKRIFISFFPRVPFSPGTGSVLPLFSTRRESGVCPRCPGHTLSHTQELLTRPYFFLPSLLCFFFPSYLTLCGNIPL